MRSMERVDRIWSGMNDMIHYITLETLNLNMCVCSGNGLRQRCLLREGSVGSMPNAARRSIAKSINKAISFHSPHSQLTFSSPHSYWITWDLAQFSNSNFSTKVAPTPSSFRTWRTNKTYNIFHQI